MTRRLDYRTAEHVSMALLTRRAFGIHPGMQYALHAGLPARLIAEVFDRDSAHIRQEVQGMALVTDRRQHTRSSDPFRQKAVTHSPGLHRSHFRRSLRAFGFRWMRVRATGRRKTALMSASLRPYDTAVRNPAVVPNATRVRSTMDICSAVSWSMRRFILFYPSGIGSKSPTIATRAASAKKPTLSGLVAINSAEL